jgi:hypothetical protein
MKTAPWCCDAGVLRTARPLGPADGSGAHRRCRPQDLARPAERSERPRESECTDEQVAKAERIATRDGDDPPPLRFNPFILHPSILMLTSPFATPQAQRPGVASQCLRPTPPRPPAPGRRCFVTIRRPRVRGAGADRFFRAGKLSRLTRATHFVSTSDGRKRLTRTTTCRTGPSGSSPRWTPAADHRATWTIKACRRASRSAAARTMPCLQSGDRRERPQTMANDHSITKHQTATVIPH